MRGSLECLELRTGTKRVPTTEAHSGQSGPSKICGRQPIKNLNWCRPYPFKFFKGCLPLLNTWIHLEPRPGKHLRWSVLLNVVNYFRKKLHLWCLTGLWMRLWVFSWNFRRTPGFHNSKLSLNPGHSLTLSQNQFTVTFLESALLQTRIYTQPNI